MTKILVAKIISAVGIKGEVKIISYCDDEKSLQKYDLFDEKDEKFSLKILKNSGATKLGDKIFVVKINGINSRNDAEMLVKKELFTLRENFKKLKNDEFYIVDLIGLSVVDENLKKIGIVKDVNDYGASPIIEIDFLSKNMEITTFPFNEEIFPEVNIGASFIKISTPEII
jgi:16S rRNA processing protein RimM